MLRYYPPDKKRHKQYKKNLKETFRPNDTKDNIINIIKYIIAIALIILIIKLI